MTKLHSENPEALAYLQNIFGPNVVSAVAVDDGDIVGFTKEGEFSNIYFQVKDGRWFNLSSSDWALLVQIDAPPDLKTEYFRTPKPVSITEQRFMSFKRDIQDMIDRRYENGLETKSLRIGCTDAEHSSSPFYYTYSSPYRDVKVSLDPTIPEQSGFTGFVFE